SFVMFKALAKDNDDQDAAYLVAYMYENGLGCKKDTDEANRWYKISSNMYYSSSKEQVGRTIDKTNKRYFHSLDKFDGNETQETIRQMTRSLYNIKAYHTNYLIPASYRYRGKYAQTGSDKPTSLETEFQISMKFDFAPNLLKLNEIYSAAYTQKSFWQSYSSSAYFRESNYNPELFVTVPTASIDDAKLIKAFRLGIAHMSNGRGGVNERSWNYANATVFFQYKNLFTELKLWTRIPDNHDYNPHLIDYLGHGDIRFTLPYNKHLLKLLVRSDFKDHGALDLSYSYPLFGRKDLFVYLKAFSGYGESLIDYDNYVNKIGFGISISR
ncbi:phospholipase A, partial [bacterium]|nr:phospholipase A [bacterium]